tara:strand:+ start:809 stop:982 length:174 start_codon:yes stop_codon:yes gene_type:complete
MSKKKIAELEARIEDLEQVIVRAYLWVGVKPTVASKDYMKTMREVAAIRNEVINREG